MWTRPAAYISNGTKDNDGDDEE